MFCSFTKMQPPTSPSLAGEHISSWTLLYSNANLPGRGASLSSCAVDSGWMAVQWPPPTPACLSQRTTLKSHCLLLPTPGNLHSDCDLPGISPLWHSGSTSLSMWSWDSLLVLGPGSLPRLRARNSRFLPTGWDGLSSCWQTPGCN